MEKADVTEPTLEGTSTVARDAVILARLGFAIAFFNHIRNTSHPREFKDKWIQILKAARLSEEMLDSVEELMVLACEPHDESKDK